MMHIGMLLDQPFPPDARVEREAVALVEAGFQVTLLCSTHSLSTAQQLPDTELYRGIRVVRVRPDRQKGLLRALSWSLFRVDKPWQRQLEAFLAEYAINVLHVHDLRLVPTALHVAQKQAKKRISKLGRGYARGGTDPATVTSTIKAIQYPPNLPIIADLHENYPALMQLLKSQKSPQHGKKAYRQWNNLETRVLKQVTHTLVVIDDARDRLIAKGLPPHNITVIANTVDTDKFLQAAQNPLQQPAQQTVEQAAQTQALFKMLKTKRVLTYVGHLNNTHRGIHTVLEAMAHLLPQFPNLHFVAVGPLQPAYQQQLQALIHKHSLQDHVTFTGWQDETAFVPYIQAAEVCLCPHQANPHTDATFPNKVYLYHLFQKPVVVSSCRPLARYIEDTQGGRVFASEEAVDLARVLASLLSQPEEANKLGQNGYQAVMQTYNWSATSQALVQVYRQLK